MLLNHVLPQINNSDLNTSENVKSVNYLLTAIQWIKEAWDKVNPENVHRCFKTCGVNFDDPENQPKRDPFADTQEHLDGFL